MTRRELLKLMQGNICPYCNCRLYNSTIEHIVPKAVHKWTKEYLPNDEHIRLMDIINSTNNVIVVHEHCNVYRGLENISVEHLNPEDRDFIKDKIELYNSILEKVKANQNNRCYKCGSTLKGTIYPRRKADGAKVIDNCAALCAECNVNTKSLVRPTYSWRW